MAERTPVIMNPAARSTKAARMVTTVQALKPKPEMHYTSYAGHAALIAEQLAREGCELIVAAGGDGTVNEVLQGICKVNATRSDTSTHTALGTLPAGTMNVFAYEIGYPSHRKLSKPWQIMSSGSRKTIDLWMANDQYFLQLAGIGVDAEVVRHTTWDMKKRYGPLSYVMSGIRVLNDRPPCLSVRLPGRPDMLGSLVLVGNGKHYGGPFSMFRRARQRDGLLDVVIFRERLNAWHGLQMLCGALVDGYRSSEDIDYLQLDEFTVVSEATTALQVDGELSGHTPVTFKKAPFPLRIAAL
jgi:YegS/Rv2252/BmrU family lipid kinase